MENSRFDDFTRSLGRERSRRSVLRGLAGGLAALIPGGALAGVEMTGRSLVICHATGNPSAPYQSVTIQQSDMNFHARHGDFLRVDCCTDSDCISQGQATCETGYCTGTFTCGATGSPCTLNNFISVCCKGPSGGVGCNFIGGDVNNGTCLAL